MAQIKKQSQSSIPTAHHPIPTSNCSGLSFTARLKWPSGCLVRGDGTTGRRELIPLPWGTPSCKHGQGPGRPQSQGKLLSLGCKPTSFAARQENDHQVRVGCMCVCVWKEGQGGLLVMMSPPKPLNEAAFRQETGKKPQSTT